MAEIWNKNQGVSLIELMVVLCILALVGVMGFPSYLEHVRKTARKEAVGQILAVASRVEQFRTQKLHLPRTEAELAMFANTERRYRIAVNTVVDQVGAEAYVVTASPRQETDQIHDRCGTIKYRSNGAWAFSGEGLTEQDCL